MENKPETEDGPQSFEDIEMMVEVEGMIKEFDFTNYCKKTRIIKHILDEHICPDMFDTTGDKELALKRVILDSQLNTYHIIYLRRFAIEIDSSCEKQSKEIKELRQTVENLAEIINKKDG